MAELNEGEILGQLQRMNPYEFEVLIGEVWESFGYDTKVRQGSGDRAIDVEAVQEIPHREKVLIQVKRYGRGQKIGSMEVRNYQTLYKQEEDADNVVLVTSGTFTPQAEQLARDFSVKVVDGDSLAGWIRDDLERYTGWLDFPEDEEEDEPSTEYTKLKSGPSRRQYDYSEDVAEYDRQHDR